MTPPPNQRIERGQIWDINFEPQVGAEIAKIRPAVVLSIPDVGRLPLRIVVPITTGSSHLHAASWVVRIVADRANGLSHDSYADAFQVKSISLDRFVRRRGRLFPHDLELLAASVAMCVGFSPSSRTQTSR